MSCHTYIYYGYGIKDFTATEEELCEFILDHEDSYRDMGNPEVVDYVLKGGKTPSVEFDDFEEGFSGEQCSLCLLTSVIQHETGVGIEYRSGDDENMIALLETYPWNLKTEEVFLAKESVDIIFKKYLAGFKAYSNPDYVQVECYG